MSSPEKETVLADVWAIATPPWGDSSAKLVQARACWNAYGYRATWTAFVMAYRAFEAYALDASPPAGHVNMVVAPPPPDEVLHVIGTRSRGLAVFRAAWDLIAGMQVPDLIGVDDPMLEDQLKAFDRDGKGSAVYILAWLTAKAVSEGAGRQGATMAPIAREVHRLTRVQMGLEAPRPGEE